MEREQVDRRIAVFQAEWPIQSHTSSCVLMLAEAGYEVELFVFNLWNPKYVDTAKLEQNGRIKVYDLSVLAASIQWQTDVEMRATLIRRLRSSLRNWLPKLASLYSLVHSSTSTALRNGRHLYWLLRRSEEGLLSDGIVARALELIGEKRCRCFIGVVEEGLDLGRESR